MVTPDNSDDSTYSQQGSLTKRAQKRMDECVNTHRFNRLDLSVRECRLRSNGTPDAAELLNCKNPDGVQLLHHHDYAIEVLINHRNKGQTKRG